MFTRLITSCIIWLRGLEGENLVAAGALDNVATVSKHHLGLLILDTLEPLRAQSLTQVISLHKCATLLAAALSKLATWQLGEQLFFGVSSEALHVELMVAAVSEEHLHLARALFLIGELGETVHAPWC